MSGKPCDIYEPKSCDECRGAKTCKLRQAHKPESSSGDSTRPRSLPARTASIRYPCGVCGKCAPVEIKDAMQVHEEIILDLM